MGSTTPISDQLTSEFSFIEVRDPLMRRLALYKAARQLMGEEYSGAFGHAAANRYRDADAPDKVLMVHTLADALEGVGMSGTAAVLRRARDTDLKEVSHTRLPNAMDDPISQREHGVEHSGISLDQPTVKLDVNDLERLIFVTASGLPMGHCPSYMKIINEVFTGIADSYTIRNSSGLGVVFREVHHGDDHIGTLRFHPDHGSLELSVNKKLIPKHETIVERFVGQFGYKVLPAKKEFNVEQWRYETLCSITGNKQGEPTQSDYGSMFDDLWKIADKDQRITFYQKTRFGERRYEEVEGAATRWDNSWYEGLPVAGAHKHEDIAYWLVPASTERIFLCDRLMTHDDDSQVTVRVENPRTWGNMPAAEWFKALYFDFKTGHYPVDVWNYAYPTGKLEPSDIDTRVMVNGADPEDHIEDGAVVARLLYDPKTKVMEITASKNFPDDAGRGDPVGTGRRLSRYGYDRPYERLIRGFTSKFM